MTIHTHYWQSPFGLFRIEATDNGIRSIQPVDTVGDQRPSALTEECVAQLDQFVAGARTSFTVPIDPQGTPFQQSVWSKAASLPFGSTVTYGELAELAGSPKAGRAVGSALNKNPIPIIIPCHRIVPRGKGIGGFAFGAAMKTRLLEIEATGL